MTCLDCNYKNNKKKSKSCPDYIYCNRLRFWRNLNDLCSLVRQKENNYMKNINL